MTKYIYEHNNWTDFTWHDKAINVIFGEVRLTQGKIIGQMNSLGFSAKEEASLNALSLEVVKSSEIEGELLNYDQVRSSIARRLGINTAGLVPSSRHIEGVVEMMLDATQRYSLPLTEKRLFGWHQHFSLQAIVDLTKLKLDITAQVKCKWFRAQWAKKKCITKL